MTHVSIFEVPRVDRSAIMARAERLSELQPLYTLSEALYRAALDYEAGRIRDVAPEEQRLIDAVVSRPATLMKGHTR